MKKTNRMVLKNTRVNALFPIVASIILTVGIAFIIWLVWFRPIYDHSGLPLHNVSFEFISSRTEAKLSYPNSTILSHFGQSEKHFEVSESAFAGMVMASNDPPEKVYQWYHDWLLTHGWHEDKHAFAGLADTQVSLQGYARGARETLYIAMDNPKTLGQTVGKQVPTNATVFEISYFIN